MERAIDLFLEDELVECLIGFALYFSILCWIQTYKDNRLTRIGWLRKNWFQFLIGILVCLIMVAKDDDIMHEFFESGKVWPWYIYFCGGFVLNILYQIVDIIPRVSEYFVKKYTKRFGIKLNGK